MRSSRPNTALANPFDTFCVFALAAVALSDALFAALFVLSDSDAIRFKSDRDFSCVPNKPMRATEIAEKNAHACALMDALLVLSLTLTTCRDIDDGASG